MNKLGEFVKQNPDIKPRFIAEKFGVTKKQVYVWRKKFFGPKHKKSTSDIPNEDFDKPYCNTLYREGKSIELIASAECEGCEIKRKAIVDYLKGKG